MDQSKDRLYFGSEKDIAWLDNINLQFKSARIFNESTTQDFQIATFCLRSKIFEIFQIFLKYFNSLLPSAFQNMFTINQDLHSYDARHSCDIVQEVPSTKRASFLSRSFVPNIWNLLPCDIWNLNNITLFKQAAKGHYKKIAKCSLHLDPPAVFSFISSYLFP